ASDDLVWAVIRSLILAFASAALATLFGASTAFGLPQLSPRLRTFVQSSLVMPMVLPEIGMGISLLVWFLQIRVPLGWGSLVWAHVGFCLGYSVLVMKVAVEGLNRSLIDAAQDLGASGWSLFRHAVLPQIAPGLFSSFVTCLALSLDDFLISFFVKGI